MTATTAGRRRRRRLPDGARPWLLLSPALFVVLVLFTGGLVLGFLQSLDYMPLIGKYDFRRGHQGSGDRHPLPFTAGQLRR